MTPPLIPPARLVVLADLLDDLLRLTAVVRASAEDDFLSARAAAGVVFAEVAKLPKIELEFMVHVLLSGCISVLEAAARDHETTVADLLTDLRTRLYHAFLTLNDEETG